MTHKVFTIIGTKNPEWGFYGTVKGILRTDEKTTQIWINISTAIMKITNFNETQTQELLDSKWGRHTANSFYDELKDGTFIEAFQKRVSKSDLIKAYNDYIAPSAYHNPRETNKELFCKELAKLSKKYGIVIQSVGGVIQNNNGFIRYNEDLDSGDLMPIWEDE
ncbi:MAG: hypothetical protein R3Y43_04190 [Alphaproteobacteria bacterium]